MREIGPVRVNRICWRRLRVGMRRLRVPRAHLVGHHVFDKPSSGAVRAVDIDRRVELFDGAWVLACCEQRAAPVLKGVGFLPRQTVVLEGRDRFLEMGLCRRVLALDRSHNRLGALDSARQPEPILASADDLAATLKVRECFSGIAGLCSHSGQRRPAGQLAKYVSALHRNLYRSPEKFRGLCVLYSEPVHPREAGCPEQLFLEVSGGAEALGLCGKPLARELPLTFKEQELRGFVSGIFSSMGPGLGEFSGINAGDNQKTEQE